MSQAAATVRRQLDTARQARDVVKSLCLSDKLSQIDVAARSARDRQAALQASAQRNDLELSNHEFTMLTVLRQRSEQLTAEANQCLGEDLSFRWADRGHYGVSEPARRGHDDHAGTSADRRAAASASLRHSVSCGPRVGPSCAGPRGQGSQRNVHFTLALLIGWCTFALTHDYERPCHFRCSSRPAHAPSGERAAAPLATG